MREASSKFNILINSRKGHDSPDVRELIYYYGMKGAGNIDSWNILWDMFCNETDMQEKKRLMKGLAGSQEYWIIKKYLEAAWNEKYIPRHDFFQCLMYISDGNLGGSLVWDHIRNNWETITDRYTFSDTNLQEFIVSITNTFCTKVKLEEVKQFFDKYPNIADDVKKLTLSNIQNNIWWLESNSSHIDDWLAENNLLS